MKHEHTLFVKHSKGKIFIANLYVGDLIYTDNKQQMFEGFKESMRKMFAMINMGKMRYFLKVEVKEESAGIFIYQQKYAKEILTRFGMDLCNKVCNPIVSGFWLNKDENGKPIYATSYKKMVEGLK